MAEKNIKFEDSSVSLITGKSFSYLRKITEKETTVLLTDENVFNAHKEKFNSWQTIVIKAGEKFKTQRTVDAILKNLVHRKADRNYSLVGVGGGVITDIAGYVASVYMRGIRFGFVPTTLLALVDASIGGKNGINLGVHKNMIGLFNHPSFILHDLSFLSTLQDKEWNNGFAEIIKHACIKDASLFKLLEEARPARFRKDNDALKSLIEKNIKIKYRIVAIDEKENGERMLLNFGHTLGHAIENQYQLSHGEAISIGMSFACDLSDAERGFKQAVRVKNLLEKYRLPVHYNYDKNRVMQVLRMDKKKKSNVINFVLLDKIGKAGYFPLSLEKIKKAL